MTNALDLVLTREWAMQRDALECLLKRAVDRGGSFDATALPEWCTWAKRAQEVQAVQLQGGGKLDGTRRTTVRDGVAIVPILGPIFRRANMLTEVSGATSLEVIAREIQVAVASPETKAVLLEIDSPGGQAAGIAELAAHIVTLNRKKPICAYIGATGASAAYWLAAACGGIVAAPTAVVGSIGVLGAYQKDDGETITVVSSQSPKKHLDLETEDGRGELQRVMDDLAAVFISDVARYRGVSERTVLNDFGQGGVLVGASALQAGMVDRIGSLESTLRTLAKDPQSLCATNRKRAEGGTEPTAEDADQLLFALGVSPTPQMSAAEEPEPSGVAETQMTDETISGEAHAAKPFEEELDALLADARDSRERESAAEGRARDIHATRQDAGRTLGQARREQIREIRSVHAAAVTEWDALLADTEPRASASERVRLQVAAQTIEAESLAADFGALLGGSNGNG